MPVLRNINKFKCSIQVCNQCPVLLNLAKYVINALFLFTKGIEGSNITVTFEDFSLEPDSSCEYDWLQVRTEAPFITGGRK